MKTYNPVVPEIYQALHDQFWELQQNYSKILPIRLDLYYSPDTALHRRRNDDYATYDIRRFIHSMSQLDGVVATAWVMEHGEERGVHFHVVIYVNGQQHNSSWNFVDEAQYRWEAITDEQGWIHVPKPDDGHYRINALKMISHENTQAIRDWFYAMDYLAKQRSKLSLGYVYQDYDVSTVKAKSTRGRRRRVVSVGQTLVPLFG